MKMAKKSKKHKSSDGSGTIAQNRKARHNYTLETRFEAGIVLEGWEVKSIRAGRIQIAESHVIIRRGEIWLVNSIISPLTTASTHVTTEESRTRKLLLNKKEISNLIGHVERKGYTIVPVAMYWKKNRIKIEIALAKGKKAHDKRAALKEQDWQKSKNRMFKKG